MERRLVIHNENHETKYLTLDKKGVEYRDKGKRTFTCLGTDIYRKAFKVAQTPLSTSLIVIVRQCYVCNSLLPYCICNVGYFKLWCYYSHFQQVTI